MTQTYEIKETCRLLNQMTSSYVKDIKQCKFSQKSASFNFFFLFNFYEIFSSHKLYSHGYGVT